MPRLRIHHLVEFEFSEVRSWYDDLSPLAAENFAACFLAALDRVQRHPTTHAPWRPPFRRIRLARFPYLLLFHTDKRTTSVLALVHERRDPGHTFTTLSRRKEDFG